MQANAAFVSQAETTLVVVGQNIDQGGVDNNLVGGAVNNDAGNRMRVTTSPLWHWGGWRERALFLQRVILWRISDQGK